MNDASKGFFIALGLALVVAAGLAVWLLGSDRLMTLALIFVIGLTLAVVFAASSLPIRAFRRRDMTGETHHFHDGTKTVVREVRILDGRQVTAPEVKLLQLPAQPQGGAFPELLRAAYAAGALTDRGQAASYAAPVAGADLAEVDLTGGDSDGWGGDIVP
jgi:hypothetical protein